MDSMTLFLLALLVLLVVLMAIIVVILSQLRKAFSLIERLDIKVSEHFRYIHPDQYHYILTDKYNLEVEDSLLR
jgi:hypothetical protein